MLLLILLRGRRGEWGDGEGVEWHRFGLENALSVTALTVLQTYPPVVRT